MGHAPSPVVHRPPAWIGCWVGFLLLWTGSVAGAEDAPVLDLSTAQLPMTLGGYWQVLIDPDSELSFEDVRGTAASRFAAEARDGLSLGFTDATVWLHFRVRNTAADEDDWLLEFDYPVLDRIEVYSRAGSTGAWTRVVSGDAQPYSSRPVPHRTFLFPAEFQGDGVRDRVHRDHQWPCRSVFVARVPGLGQYRATVVRRPVGARHPGVFPVVAGPER